MNTDIIVAIISGCAILLAAVIGGIFSFIAQKSKNNDGQKIQGNGNIQAGKNVNITGDVRINAKTNNKRK